MTKFVIILKPLHGRGTVQTDLCETLNEGIGAAVVALDRAMRSAGFEHNYKLFNPICEDGIVNLTAESGKKNGYPESTAMDAFVCPVNFGTDLSADWEVGS
jgi:hypothetical protein